MSLLFSDRTSLFAFDLFSDRYDMLNGGPPFTGRDRNEAKKAVCRGKLKLKRWNPPELLKILLISSYFTMNARDLMKGLLNRQPANRLGAGPNDYLDIKVMSKLINPWVKFILGTSLVWRNRLCKTTRAWARTAICASTSQWRRHSIIRWAFYARARIGLAQSVRISSFLKPFLLNFTFAIRV